MKKPGVTEAYLDNLFSLYIRLRDADSNGNVTCCNCGKTIRWTEATNGHFVKRRHRALRWDERNCHPECAECNAADVNLGYVQYMVNRYGAWIFEELNNKKNTTAKIMPVERRAMANKIRSLIHNLKQTKGL